MDKGYLVNKLVEEYQIFSSYSKVNEFVINEIEVLHSFSISWVLLDLLECTLSSGIHQSIQRIHKKYAPKTVLRTFKLLEERYNG